MKSLSYTLLIILFFAASAMTQTFADFLVQLNSAAPNERQALVDSFLNTVSAFPILEQDTLAHFIYQGSANTVTVPGDANGWNPSGSAMTDVYGTDFWYRSEVYEQDARLDYKYVLNGSTWILDPKNPNQVMGGYGPNSELRMPAYVMPPEIEYYPNISHGTYEDTLFYSVNLGNSRTVRVYLPSGYHSNANDYPMILLTGYCRFCTPGEPDRRICGKPAEPVQQFHCQ
jgi:enterochelin esterase family protein